METLIMRNGMVVCSTAEARKWEEDGCIPDLPAPGDTVIRFRNNVAPEVGRVGVRVAMGHIEDASVPDTNDMQGVDRRTMHE